MSATNSGNQPDESSSTPFVPTPQEEWTRDTNVVGFSIILLCTKSIVSHIAQLFGAVAAAAYFGEGIFIIASFYVLALFTFARSKKNSYQVRWMFTSRVPGYLSAAVLGLNLLILGARALLSVAAK